MEATDSRERAEIRKLRLCQSALRGSRRDRSDDNCWPMCAFAPILIHVSLGPRRGGHASTATTETPYGEATSSPDPRRLGTETIEYLEEPSRLVSARSARARSSSGTLALSVPLWTSRSLAEPISLVRLRVSLQTPTFGAFLPSPRLSASRARGGAAYDLLARLMSQPNRHVQNGPERCPHAASSTRGTKRRESCSDRWSRGGAECQGRYGLESPSLRWDFSRKKCS